MPCHRIFQRSPRLLPRIPQGEEELRAPEAPPARPSASLSSRMEDVFFTGGASIAGAVVMGMVTHSGVSAGLGAGCMFTFGVLRGVFGYRREKREYERMSAERITGHRAYLASRRADWEEQRDAQWRAMRELDPDPAECLARAERVDVRLFERGPSDPDFLSLRLGLGEQPFGLHVRGPAADVAGEELLEETRRLAAEFASVGDVPVCAPFGALGAVGLAGPREAIVAAARGLLVQLATHHSPDEVKLVVLHPPNEDWSWVRWLPHVWSGDRRRRFLACDPEGARDLLDDLHDILKTRSLREKEGSRPLPVYVVVLASGTLVGEDPVLELLQQEGARLGALGLFFGGSVRELPRSCHTLVQAGPGQPRLLRTRPASDTPYTADEIDSAEADRLARALAPLRVSEGSGAGEIPDRASLLDLLGIGNLEELDVVGGWLDKQPFRSLAVPVGLQSGGRTLEFDLHESRHGPHGLVAGTTGSGKTVFMTTYLIQLAATFHPHEVSFVCVDYKGGDLFRGLEELPHLVGTLTNLERSEVWRCLRALKAENQRRMRLMSHASQVTGATVSKIDDYQKLRREGAPLEPLPKLLIVVDEFAELSKQEPEFIDELVSVARIGRSLGTHLVLATQQPAGIIGPQIEPNMRFRFAFKFNSEEDSKAVLNRPDAASIRQSGRGFFQLGKNEIFELFQAAYGGTEYVPGGPAQDEPQAREVLLDGSRRRLGRGTPAGGTATRGPSQLQALAARIVSAAAEKGVSRLPGPWLPPMPPAVHLPDLQTAPGWSDAGPAQPRAWLRPVVGLLDDPGRSFQGPLELDLARDGHLAVFGRPGVGSTTVLQSLVFSLARQHDPEDLHLYIVDFGGLALTRLRGLPHVGDVVTSGEPDRMARLLRFLLRQVARRKEQLAASGATTLAAYRATGRRMPAVLLVLDNYGRFAREHPDEEELLASLAQEGAGPGVYVALTAASPSTLKPRIAGTMGATLCLQLADRTEYPLAVGRTEGLEPAPLPGRGLLRAKPPLEFQAALPFRGAGEVERAAAADDLMARMSQRWTGPKPPPVPVVPGLVTLDLVEAGVRAPFNGPFTSVPVGLDVDEVEPFRLAPGDGPHFLVTGSLGSGKTAFLVSWTLALAASLPPGALEITLVDFREGLLQPLSRLPQVKEFVDSDSALETALGRLKTLAEDRRTAMKDARMAAGGVLDETAWVAAQSTHVLMIDDFEGLRQEASAVNQEDLASLVKASRGLGIHVVLAGSTDDLGSNTYDSILKALAGYRTGILLGTRDDNGVFGNVRIPAETGETPVGRGFFVQRGAVKARFQTARPGAQPADLLHWLDRLSAPVPS